MKKVKLSKVYKSTVNNEKKLESYVYDRLLRGCEKTSK